MQFAGALLEYFFDLDVSGFVVRFVSIFGNGPDLVA
jgi:hypothetical protein